MQNIKFSHSKSNELIVERYGILLTCTN